MGNFIEVNEDNVVIGIYPSVHTPDYTDPKYIPVDVVPNQVGTLRYIDGVYQPLSSEELKQQNEVIEVKIKAGRATEIAIPTKEIMLIVLKLLIEFGVISADRADKIKTRFKELVNEAITNS